MNANIVANLVLIVCASAITALVVRRELMPEPPAVQMRVVGNWEGAADGGHVVYGSEEAPVKVVEFGDFQCGACAEAGKQLRELQARHPELVSVAYRHYPLGHIHEHAYTAAVSSECAADQGVFRAYYELLFEEQRNIGRVPWTELATRAGVRDTLRFHECLQDGSVAHERVARDTAVAYHVGVRVTPTFVVNGNMLLNRPVPERWDQLVKGFAQAVSAEAEAKR